MTTQDTPRDAIRMEKKGRIVTIIIDRPEVRNAIDSDTAGALSDALRAFEADPEAYVAVICGAGGHFCAGGDLAAMVAHGENPIRERGDGPLGLSRLVLSKPVIAAVSGYAVAGGLELALFCDLRIAEESSVFGVFNRRWGLPLCNGGTVRLPRIIGHGRAMDMILTGRPVDAAEALSFGLVTRVVADGRARMEAEGLAEAMAAFPPEGMRCDRHNAIHQHAFGVEAALDHELNHAAALFDNDDALMGARAFVAGKGRHGDFSGSGKGALKK